MKSLTWYTRRLCRQVRRMRPDLFPRRFKLDNLRRKLATAQHNELVMAEELLNLRAKLKAAEDVACMDPLTGLLNRRGEKVVICPEIHALQRQSDKPFSVSVLLIDLDHFKVVKDRHGHAKGDEILLIISEWMCEVYHRDTDHLVRPGGDEFAIVSIHTSLTSGMQLARDLLRRINADPRLTLEKNDVTTQVTASMGLAAMDTTNWDVTQALQEALAAADAAAYQAKATGRNDVFLA